MHPQLKSLIYYTIGFIIVSTGCQNKSSVKNRVEQKKSVEHTANIKLSPTGNVVDFDGNIYHTIKIGNQIWMAENLRVTHYTNGDTIPCVQNDKQWRQQTGGSYCYYSHNRKIAKVYGVLYNWHAVTDLRKLAPEGWHIPTEKEWNMLIAFLGGNGTAGGQLKVTGNSYWETPDNTATNQSGFCAVAAGTRNNNGMFVNAGFSASWWSATGESQADFATNYSVVSNSMIIKQDVDDRVCGLSVRCIKD